MSGLGPRCVVREVKLWLSQGRRVQNCSDKHAEDDYRVWNGQVKCCCCRRGQNAPWSRSRARSNCRLGGGAQQTRARYGVYERQSQQSATRQNAKLALIREKLKRAKQDKNGGRCAESEMRVFPRVSDRCRGWSERKAQSLGYRAVRYTPGLAKGRRKDKVGWQSANRARLR